jgi:hypothetical protein
MAKPSPHQGKQSVHFDQQMKINESLAKMDTQVCSKQMDLLMALNEYSVWRSAASRWT